METSKFVVDTNVLISALLFKSSVPFEAISFATKQGDILYSEATLMELKKVLNRRKFDKYISEDERQLFLLNFVASSKLVTITERITVCRDQKDNKFLELAVSGKAKTIVTGDLDLLILNPFRSIKVLTPDQFVADVK